MKRILLACLFIPFLLANTACRKKCEDYPTYSLCQEQVEWFRPEGEVWHFLLNGQDTVLAKLGPVNRLYHDSRRGYPIFRKYRCPQSGPMIEQGTQEINFISDKYYLFLRISAVINSDTYACNPVYYTVEEETRILDSVSINNKMYYNVKKAYIGSIYLPDTLYYSKEKGLLRVSYVKNKNVLERL